MAIDIKKIREALGATQVEFATFLEIVRSMASMMETGSRLIPSSALPLLQHLHEEWTASAVSGLPVDSALESERSERKKYAKTRKNDLKAQLAIARFRLREMEKEHHRIMKVNHFLSLVQPTGTATQAKWQREWYHIFRGNNIDKLKKCTLLTQLEMQGKIAALEAELAVMNAV